MNTIATAIIDHIVQLGFAALAPLIILLVHKLIQKTKIQALTNNQDLIDSIIQTAIKGVEQMADAAAKSNSTVMTGAQKLASAVEWVNSEMQRLNLPAIDEASLAMRIESMVYTWINSVTDSKPVVPAPAPAPVVTPNLPIIPDVVADVKASRKVKK